MKKILLILGFIAFGFATPAMAQNMAAGATLGFFQNTMEVKSDVLGFNSKATTTYNSIKANAFLDITYARFGLGYSGSVGSPETKVSSSLPGSSDTTTKSSKQEYSFINMSAVGKYPFELSAGAYFWPCVGLEYDLNVVAKDADGKDYEKKDLNDVYIVGGLGLDYYFADQMGLTISVMYGYNLTPKPNTQTYTNGSFSGYKMGINVGVITRM